MRYLATVLMVIVATQPLSVCAENYQADTHYRLLTTPVSIPADEKYSDEVWVFFRYGCPACYQFNSQLDAWRNQLGPSVSVKKIPVFQSEVESRAFYAADILGLDEAFDQTVYQRIHSDKTPLRSLQDFARLAEHYGVDAETFLNMANSFTVSTRITQGDRYARQAQIPGTPIMVVNGKYLLSGRVLGSNTKMLEVAEYLFSIDQLE